jgi:hypothetical protein
MGRHEEVRVCMWMLVVVGAMEGHTTVAGSGMWAWVVGRG